MNKYKVEFIEKAVVTYCVDVLAKTEAEAEELAEVKMQKVLGNGTYHYYETDRDETVPELTIVYDVTNTDDPFDPMNCIHSECELDGTCKVCGVNNVSTNNGII